MFGKRNSGQSGGYDEFRQHRRKGCSTEYRAYIDGVEYSVLDWSEGGFRILCNSGMARVGVAEIYYNGRRILSSPAVLAWARGGEAGYAFRPNLGVYEVKENPTKPNGRASSIRAQLGW